MSLKKIYIIGTTGSGKSTAAKKISKKFGIPHIELDSIYQGKNWESLEASLFQQQVTERLLNLQTWITDGNYSQVREIILNQADTVIWLDYPLLTVLFRVIRRTFKRLIDKEELWNGNRESWRRTFFHRENVILWALKTHKRRQKENIKLYSNTINSHLKIYRFIKPSELEDWIQLNMLKTVYVLIGPKGTGKTYIGSILEKEIGIKFLPVEKLGLENIKKSRLTGDELIKEGFHQEEAAIDEIFQNNNAVSFESTGVHPYLQNILSNLRAKYNVKLIKIYTPLEKCYERIKYRDQSLQIPVSDELLKRINEGAVNVAFNWDLEIDNSAELNIKEIILAFRKIL